MSVTATQPFVKCLANLLEEGMCDEALTIFEKEKIAVIQSVSSDIVLIAANYFTEYNEQYDTERFECCKTMLKTIAEKCNPMETVLAFLEQIEYLDNDVKFFAMLKPLRICLIKMENKGIAIEWCVSTLKSYIENLPLPKNDLEDEEDAINKRIITVYAEVVSFLELLIQKTVKNNSKLEERSLLENYLLSLLISLCGKPFCYLNKSMFEKALYKELKNKLIVLSSCLTGDVLCFLDIVSKRYRNIIRKVVHNKDVHTKYYERFMLFESSDNISNLTYACFYFYIITEEEHWKNVPQVYNFYYILEMCTYLFVTLLCNEILTPMGLIFMQHVIKQIPPCSINSDVFTLEVYLDLFRRLINVMIYHDNHEERMKAAIIFQEYVEIFDMKARYLLISYLYENNQHSNLLALIINIFKSSIVASFDSKIPQGSQHFLGKKTESFLKKICNLPHGNLSDLVEIADEIMTTLNLLIYLVIRDKNNETGIWNIESMLENFYLKQLREGIHLCKAHWTVKLKDLIQDKAHYNCLKVQDYNEMKKNHPEVTLTIAA